MVDGNDVDVWLAYSASLGAAEHYGESSHRKDVPIGSRKRKARDVLVRMLKCVQPLNSVDSAVVDYAHRPSPAPLQFYYPNYATYQAYQVFYSIQRAKVVQQAQNQQQIWVHVPAAPTLPPQLAAGANCHQLVRVSPWPQTPAFYPYTILVPTTEYCQYGGPNSPNGSSSSSITDSRYK